LKTAKKNNASIPHPSKKVSSSSISVLAKLFKNFEKVAITLLIFFVFFFRVKKKNDYLFFVFTCVLSFGFVFSHGVSGDTIDQPLHYQPGC
jgi:hypothetical protein